jgi:oxygen-dependent protoporphyrinogen oxidase
VSVGELIRDRLGDEVLEHVVGPLIGGINAGDADRLSLEASAPQIAAAARRDASLVRALRASRAEAPPDPGAPVFYSLAGGLQRLVERLTEVISADVRLVTEVTGLDRRPGGGYSVATSAGVVDADAVVLTGPAWLSARLTEGLAPDAAATLAAVEYSSVALVALAVGPEAISRPLDASGFLVPHTEGCLITACTWNSRKWAHLDRPGQVLLRASAGRYGDERIAGLTDDELVDAVRADLHTTMGLEGAPREVRVTRWRDSFPQYLPGHLGRADEIDASLAADAPGVLVAGAAQRGVGIPACIRQGREAATAALAHLGTT